MKMGNFEKTFVNSTEHSQQVSQHFDRLVSLVPTSPDQHYLDVGCGNGAAPIHIARKFGLNVTGIDVDPEQIALAQAASQDVMNAQFFMVDGTQLPFDSNHFDIVGTNKVMHHIPEWVTAFEEMIRVLKPGGYLLYTDFIFPGWVAHIGQILVKEVSGFPTKPALETIIAKNNLTFIHQNVSMGHYELICQKPY